MSKDLAPASAGWYPLPEAAESDRQVGYWDGAAWTGAQQRARRDGSQPRDIPGTVAVILLSVGFLGTIAIPVGASLLESWANISTSGLTFAMLFDLGATPAALIASIVGLVRGHELKFKTPVSLVTLVLSILGTVILVLPLALLLTGVWAIHI